MSPPNTVIDIFFNHEVYKTIDEIATEKTNLEVIANSSKIPPQSKYDILSYIGTGDWTSVHKAINKIDGSLWALKFLDMSDIAKKQREERKISIEDYWKKECLSGYATSYTNIAFNVLEKDDNGNLFLAEEYIDRFLSDYLVVVWTPNLDEIVDIGIGISSGLDVLHNKAGIVHGDLKFENIGYSLDKIVKISDFGASSLLKNRSKDPRGNSGTIVVRAYERFQDESNATEKSDIWSFGAILYKMFTGEDIYHSEFGLKSPEEIIEFMQNLDEKTADRIVDNKLKQKISDDTIDYENSSIWKERDIKKIPRRMRRIIKNCLAYDPNKRYENISDALLELKDFQEKRTATKYAKKVWNKFGVITSTFVAMGIALSGAITINYMTEPRFITKPTINNEIIYSYEDPSKIIQFECENLGLPQKENKSFYPNEMRYKISSNNAFTTYLTKSYCSASSELGMWGKDRINTIQQAIHHTQKPGSNSFPSPLDEEIIASSIDYAIAKSGLLNKGIADREDVCIIARMGIEKLLSAKLATGMKSPNYSDYIDAKDDEGKYIIPRPEKKFCETWLSYIGDISFRIND